MTLDPRGLAIATHQPADGCYVLRLEGELDLLTSRELTAALEHVLAAGATDVVVDLQEIAFVDSSGINALLVGERLLTARGGTLVLAAPSDAARRVLELAHVTRLIETADTVEEALAATEGCGTGGIER